MSQNNENKLVPRLRFPEFKNTQAWLLRTLNDVADMYQPKTISQSEFKDKGHLVYGANGVIGYYDRYNHETSQIAIACRGSSCGTVNFTEPKSWITGNAMVVNVDGFKDIDKKFMFYQLLVANFNYLITGSGQPQITGNIKNHKVVLTNLEEQQKIAACLSSLDDVITAESKKLEVLKEHKKGLLQNLFPQEGETVPKFRFEEFQDSDAWQEDTLLNIASFRRGSFPQPYGLSEWYDDEKGMPFIQVFDVDDNFRLKPATKNKISELAAKQSVFIPKGTLIITLQGSIGRVAITQYDAYIDRTILLFEEFHQEIDITFFAYSLFLLFEIEKQKAPGGIIKTITKEVLSNFVVKLPSIEEQRKISSCLSSLDELINAQSQKIETLKLHKKGLLQGLFPDINEHNG